MSDDATQEPQEKIELPPLESADTKEFENVVLEDPSGAEYIRAEYED
ncbi:hypothetical protein KA531_03180 [Candidatus Saccharibacteria bacterium]|nr:hypothetical protein [Candidatus Saccharibacteria bacterium]